MLTTSYTQPGTPGHANEDWMAVTSDLIVVADGATVRTETGCTHGVDWYTRTLGGSLLATAYQYDDLKEALAQSIKTVSDLHRDTCDLNHPGTPSAAVAVVRVDEEAVRYVVLGDVHVLIDSEEFAEVRVVSDERVSFTARKAREKADRFAIGSREKQEALLEMKAGELAGRNVEGGYWIAAADPAAAKEAIVGEVPTSQVRRLAVLSDGAARLVDLFGSSSWRSTLDDLERGGPEEFVGRVRAMETADPEGVRYARNKVSDDATAVFARFRDVLQVPLSAGEEAAVQRAIRELSARLANPNLYGGELRQAR